jgi:hypothetical protein
MLAIIFRKCMGGKALTFRFNGDIVAVKQKWQLVLNGDAVTLSKARDMGSQLITTDARLRSVVIVSLAYLRERIWL